MSGVFLRRVRIIGDVMLPNLTVGAIARFGVAFPGEGFAENWKLFAIGCFVSHILD